MMQYRKKPVVIEAVQNGGEWGPIMDWLDALAGGRVSTPFGARPSITRNEDGSLSIETLEGIMRCDRGDWLICGVKGEFYPCKPDIFAATYEAVESTPTRETFFAIRRTDGEQIGDYSWMSCDGPEDWEQAENDSEWADDPETVEYEIVEMTVRSLAKKLYPENPHEHVGDDCDYCGESWPCDWMKERATAVGESSTPQKEA